MDCVLCNFKTLKHPDLAQHILTMHVAPKKSQPPQQLKYDKSCILFKFSDCLLFTPIISPNNFPWKIYNIGI